MTERNQSRGRPFEPGNKFGRGRPAGSRNKKTVLTQNLLEECGPVLMRKAMSLAANGNVPLLRMFVQYQMDRAKDSLSKIGRLPMSNIEELIRSYQIIADKLSKGVITPIQAMQVTAVLEAHRRLFETEDLAARVSALEQNTRADRAA